MTDEYVSRREFEAFQILFREARLSDKEAIKIALDGSKEALTKAEIANEKRLDLLNEFRQQSNDRDATFLRMDVYHPQHTALGNVVETLGNRLTGVEGRVATLAGIPATIATIQDRVSSLEGRFLGLAAAGAMIGSIVAIVAFFTR